jgi:hypothetical protein
LDDIALRSSAVRAFLSQGVEWELHVNVFGKEGAREIEDYSKKLKHYWAWHDYDGAVRDKMT